MGALLDAATAAFLESGCSLVVGTSTSDGRPVATRGYGCTVLGVDEGRAELRLLVAPDDAAGVEHVAPGTPVAITATSVATLRSVQLKGRVVSLDDADEADCARALGHWEAFFGDVIATDGADRRLLERMIPLGYAAWIVHAGELFDQTPGPGAGATLGGAPS